MKTSTNFFRASVAGLSLATLFIAATEITTIGIGDKMPAGDVVVVDTEGNETPLSALKGENGTLVIFSCNTCPFVIGGRGGSQGWENRYNGVTDAATAQNVSTVLINSNEAKRDAGDDLAAMKARKAEQGLKGTYVLDKNSAVADAFGARTTPHVFLFDAEGKLAYTGAIDDNVGSAEDVKEKWLENALSALGAGKAIDPATTRNQGCSIKRLK